MTKLKPIMGKGDLVEVMQKSKKAVLEIQSTVHFFKMGAVSQIMFIH